ncbi:MAG: tripartite tricarboxylate transporter substrate binding protein [Clostridium sp.]
MKKIFTLLLTVIMVTSITGCSDKSDSTDIKDTTKSEISTTDWPKKPIQMLVPYNPGGDTDFNARAYAKRLEKVLGQPVVVTNVAGSGGAIGSRQAKDSVSDGYTLLYYHVSMFVNQAVGATDYGLEAFELGSITGRNGGNVITVSAKSPYKTLDDLMKASKANPGKLTFAANVGASTSVMGHLLNDAGGEFNLVDMGDTSERVAALMGNQLDAIPNALGTTIPYIESGDFRALAIIEDERNPLYPDLPTAIEQGYKGVSLPIYYFTAFPKGTPADIVDKFNSACEEISKMDDYKKEVADAYMQNPYFVKGKEAKDILEKQQAGILELKDTLMKAK